MLKPWLRLLYPEPTPPGPCSGYEPLPPEPGDPPGSERFRLWLSDCTEVTVLQRADGSGQEEVRLPGDQDPQPWRTMSWGVEKPVAGGFATDVVQEFRDGARMEYEMGYDPASDVSDHWERGTLMRTDGPRLAFSHERNERRDLVGLDLDDGQALSIEVPLRSVGWSLYWPVFVRPAEGSYAQGNQQRLAMSLKGTLATGWSSWRTRAPDGKTGEFALDPDLAGRGLFWSEGKLLAAFRWTAEGVGTLDPVAASSISVVPSAAARDLSIEQWIRHLSELGPFPDF